MSEQRSPARPWFDLVTEQSAIRGWGIAELARRAKVGRPTIYGWRDGAEGKIQAGPVNAVADVLGIPRERALRLAGVIGPGQAPAGSAVPPDLLKAIAEADNLTDGEKVAVIAAIDATLARERGERAQSASRSAQELRRPAS